MSAKPIRIPGPDHPITITASSKRVTVRAGGRQLASSTRALTLQEATYPGVHYLPREDADMGQLVKTSHHTYCPYKGECSYYSITSAGDRGVNAVWSYEAPYEAVAQIRGHLAFYPDRVDSITLE
jgi:uncharacterized protein (DUF427 family)